MRSFFAALARTQQDNAAEVFTPSIASSPPPPLSAYSQQSSAVLFSPLAASTEFHHPHHYLKRSLLAGASSPSSALAASIGAKIPHDQSPSGGDGGRDGGRDGGGHIERQATFIVATSPPGDHQRYVATGAQPSAVAATSVITNATAAAATAAGQAAAAACLAAALTSASELALQSSPAAAARMQQEEHRQLLAQQQQQQLLRSSTLPPPPLTTANNDEERKTASTQLKQIDGFLSAAFALNASADGGNATATNTGVLPNAGGVSALPLSSRDVVSNAAAATVATLALLTQSPPSVKAHSSSMPSAERGLDEPPPSSSYNIGDGGADTASIIHAINNPLVGGAACGVNNDEATTAAAAAAASTLLASVAATSDAIKRERVASFSALSSLTAAANVNNNNNGGSRMTTTQQVLSPNPTASSLLSANNLAAVAAAVAAAVHPNNISQQTMLSAVDPSTAHAVSLGVVPKRDFAEQLPSLPISTVSDTVAMGGTCGAANHSNLLQFSTPPVVSATILTPQQRQQLSPHTSAFQMVAGSPQQPTNQNGGTASSNFLVPQQQPQSQSSILNHQPSSISQLIQLQKSQGSPGSSQQQQLSSLYSELISLPNLLDRLGPHILRSSLGTSQQPQQFKPIPNNERVDLLRFRLKDPAEWGSDDVVAWMLDVARRYSIPCENLNMHRFAKTTGANMLKMNEQEFREFDASYGALLYEEFRKALTDESLLDWLCTHKNSGADQIPASPSKLGGKAVASATALAGEAASPPPHRLLQLPPHHLAGPSSSTRISPNECALGDQQQSQKASEYVGTSFMRASTTTSQQKSMDGFLAAAVAAATTNHSPQQQQQQAQQSLTLPPINNLASPLQNLQHQQQTLQRQFQQQQQQQQFLQQQQQQQTLRNSAAAGFAAAAQQAAVIAAARNNLASNLQAINNTGALMRFGGGTAMSNSSPLPSSASLTALKHHHIAFEDKASSSNCDAGSEPPLHKAALQSKIRKNKDGRPRKRSQHSKGNKLWEFIRDALKDPNTCPSVVRWEDPIQNRRENIVSILRSIKYEAMEVTLKLATIQGVFRIVESEKLARLWGERKNNQKMTYEKLSRAMRTYYDKQILVPVPKTGLYPKKLVYKFGPSAHGWSAPPHLIVACQHNGSVVDLQPMEH